MLPKDLFPTAASLLVMESMHWHLEKSCRQCKHGFASFWSVFVGFLDRSIASEPINDGRVLWHFAIVSVAILSDLTRFCLFVAFANDNWHRIIIRGKSTSASLLSGAAFRVGHFCPRSGATAKYTPFRCANGSDAITGSMVLMWAVCKARSMHGDGSEVDG